MQTIRLRVSEKIIGNLLSLFSRFNKEEIEIITEDEEFVSVSTGKYVITFLLRYYNTTLQKDKT